MVVNWTKYAETRLSDIYDFYSEKSIDIAKQIVAELIDATHILIDFPNIAAVEPALKKQTEVFRSLVVRNHYKIIYFVREENIFIATIWDCRQQPQKLINEIRKEN